MENQYAPFILSSQYHSLILPDWQMLSRSHIFEERAAEGWTGNGYDWTAIARVVLRERLAEIEPDISFDSEAGMFTALGPVKSLERLAKELRRVFEDEEELRRLLSRAVLD